MALRFGTLTFDDRAYVQAGAGIVYDSDPATEYDEAVNKSMALRRAISVAKAMLSRG